MQTDGLEGTSQSLTLEHSLPSLPPIGPGPINKLPSDCLEEIFSYAVPIADLNILSPNWAYLHQLSLVCRKWRYEAIMAPRLWTHVYPVHLPRATLEQFLQRSGCLEVDVSLQYGLIDDDSWAVLKAAVSRFRVLKIYFPVMFEWSCWANLFEAHPDFRGFLASAGSLRTFAMEGNIEGDILPLFDGPIPTLGSCTLRSPFRLRWPTNVFSMLTDFEVRTRSDIHGEFFEGILETARSNPNLETLEVSCPMTDGWKPRAGYPRISLPMMKQVALVVHQLAARGFLSCLTLPATTWFYLDILLDEDTLPDGAWPETAMHAIFPEDTSFLPSLSTINSLGVSNLEDEKEIRFYGSAGKVFVLTLKIHYGDLIDEEPTPFARPGNLDWLCEWLLTIRHALPTSRIIDVAIIGEDIEFSELWHGFLQCFPNLKSVTAHASIAAVLSALQIPSLEVARDGSIMLVLPCPNLLELTVVFCRLQDRPKVTFMLSRVVKERFARGLPLQHASITMQEPLELDRSDDLLLASALVVPEYARLQRVWPPG